MHHEVPKTLLVENLMFFFFSAIARYVQEAECTYSNISLWKHWGKTREEESWSQTVKDGAEEAGDHHLIMLSMLSTLNPNCLGWFQFSFYYTCQNFGDPRSFESFNSACRVRNWTRLKSLFCQRIISVKVQHLKGFLSTKLCTTHLKWWRICKVLSISLQDSFSTNL